MLRLTKTEVYSNGVIVKTTKEFDVEWSTDVDIDKFDNSSNNLVETMIFDEVGTFYAYNDEADALMDEKIWDAGAHVIHVQLD